MSGRASTIRDLVASLRELDEGDRFEVGPAIYAPPLGGPAARQSSCERTSSSPRERPGFRLVLEASIACEVLRVWSSWRDGRAPTSDEAAEAVIHYALTDAYQPVGDSG